MNKIGELKKLKNNNYSLFEKGTFEPFDNAFMAEGHEALIGLQGVQEKFDKGDTDTFINELRDSIAGYSLGFDLVNIDKHGFDCKRIGDPNLYLEVKSASFSANTWQATFNDTTLEKADTFKDEKLFLALAVWKNASDLLFICFGQNKELGHFLTKKVNHFLGGNTVRSTQSLGLSRLIFEFGFKIVTGGPGKKPEDIIQILNLKSSTFKKIKAEDIIAYEDFTKIDDY